LRHDAILSTRKDAAPNLGRFTGGYVSVLLPVQEPSEVMCSPALQATAMWVVSCGHKVTDEEL
ncbi:hypothetical protein, partial [Kocuria salsicia]|uniref:hypothetical protein n=1 Tax=Kocuria salsicia TaxID=664639 RepID=UPI001C92D64D